MIGFERETKDHAAGLRNHILVCMDPVRMIEAVTGGVAFLAAGLIVFTRGVVKWLTIGASL